MKRGSTLLVCLTVGIGLSCGGTRGLGAAGTGGAAGAASGRGGSGAAGGSSGGVNGAAGAGSGGHGTAGSAGSGTAGSTGSGTAGAAGGSPRDAAVSDARDGSTQSCAVAGPDGGTLPCTTMLATANTQNYFCALKAGGGPGSQIKCWGPATLPYFAADVAAAPPHLVQLSVSDGLADYPPYCGVDDTGVAICWDTHASFTLGSGMRAAVVSIAGECALSLAGTVSCPPGTVTPDTGPTTTQLFMVGEQLTLDSTGTLHPPYLPDGIYTEVVANYDDVAAVRSDGAIVVNELFHYDTRVTTGSYVHVAIDLWGNPCAIDRTGAISCWQIDDAGVVYTAPTGGPFVQIVGAATSYCALRASGTTVCWGGPGVDVDAPAGW